LLCLQDFVALRDDSTARRYWSTVGSWILQVETAIIRHFDNRPDCTVDFYLNQILLPVCFALERAERRNTDLRNWWLQRQL